MWPIFYYKVLKTAYFWFYQQGELPKPGKTEPWEKWGVYSLGDFIAENWLYLSVIVLMVVLYLTLRKRRKSKKE